MKRLMMAAVALQMAVLSPVATRWATAQDELAATTELGITITPQQIFDAIQETQDFWPPVRHYVASDAFTVADADTRRQAADFFKRANNQLHDRMFGDDEAAAMDLIDYLSQRLRLFVFYRRLRQTVDNDELTVAIKDHWEKSLRDVTELTGQRRAARIEELSAAMAADLAAIGVPADKSAASVEIFSGVLAVTERMRNTSAGGMMVSFEQEAKRADATLGKLIRDIVAAADWALITKPDETLVKRVDFERAWRELERFDEERTARLKPATPKG